MVFSLLFIDNSSKANDITCIVTSLPSMQKDIANYYSVDPESLNCLKLNSEFLLLLKSINIYSYPTIEKDNIKIAFVVECGSVPSGTLKISVNF